MIAFQNFLSSKQKPIVGICILIAALALAFTPVFFGRWAYEEDSIFYSLPFYKFYSDALKNGESYDLAPGILSGFPVSLTYSGGLNDPLNSLIFRFFPFIFGYALRTFLNYALAAVFVFLLCRALGMRDIASLVSAFAFITTNVRAGFIMAHSGSFLILTGLFYIAARIFEGGKFFSWRNAFSVVLGIGIFYSGMVGGAAQFNLQSLVLLFLFILFLSWRKYAETKSMRSLMSPYFSFGVIFAAGIAFFIPHLVRVLEFVPHTIRGGGLSWPQAFEPSSPLFEILHRVRSLLFVFFPRTFGIPEVLESSSLFFFMGSAALLFFVCSFFLEKNPHWRVFFWLFIFAFLSSFPYPLFYAMHQLPLFAFFRAPGSWLLFNAMLPASVMVGFGCQSFMETKPSRSAKAALAAVAAFVLLALLFLVGALWDEPRLIIFNHPTGWDVLWALAVWIPAGCWFYAAIRRPEDKTSAALNAFLMIVVISGVVITFWAQLFDKASSVNAHSLLRKPWVEEEIEKREERGEPFRAFNFFAGDTQWFLFVKNFNPDAQALVDFQRDAVRPGNLPLLYDTESVSGTHDNLITRRYEKAQFFFEKMPLFDAVKEERGYAFIDIPENKISALGMMNVKYVWSSIPLLEMLQDKVELIALKILDPHRIGIFLYRNKSFLPRIHSPKRILFLAEDEANFPYIFEQNHNFKEVGFIECDDPVSLFESSACLADTAGDQTPPAITIKETHNDSISFSTDGQQDAWIIISNSFIPRWRAYIDGTETKIYHANYVYQGIRVRAGKHEVVMRYEG